MERHDATPLIRALDDSCRAYEAALGRAEQDYLHDVLGQILERRRGLARRLEALGDGERRSLGSAAAPLRRAWTALRDRVSPDEHGLLAGLERSEEAILRRYRRALQEDRLPRRLEREVVAQLQELVREHDLVRDLRLREKGAREA